MKSREKYIEEKIRTYSNPILPGFYPDPSLCRVEDDYYLVTSSFTYFPGVPIFHSKDLVHWNQIGNVLDRESQIPLAEGHHSMGIFAPTIRYHEGTFYLITTNVCNGGNFIVTAKKPEGPWSDPIWLNSEGIDPSLFFDDDGKCYYCGTKDRREGAKYYGDNEIYVQELHLDKMELVGQTWAIWHSALRDARWPEGPHLYKKDGWYYLLISEGGTAHEHAVSVARSKSLKDYFEGHLSNPILTHRHLGKKHPIVNVGHPDIVQTQNGEWWMVLLASRPYGGYYRNLGRETFLVPMKWEDGWPVINPGRGMVEDEFPIPKLPYWEPIKVKEWEDFNSSCLPYHFMYSRNPDMIKYSLEERKGYLRMYLSDTGLHELQSPSLVLRRQQHMTFTMETKLEFKPSLGERAGICLFQSNEYYYAFYLTCSQEGKKREVCLVKREKEDELMLVKQSIDMDSDCIYLKIHARGQDLSFGYKLDDDSVYKSLISGVDGRILSTDVAGGFVGTCGGMFATSDAVSDNFVDFDWFRMTGFDE